MNKPAHILLVEDNRMDVKPISFDGFWGVIQQIEGYWLSLNVSPPESDL